MQITGSGNDVELTLASSGTWTAGWTNLVSLKHNGAAHLFGYKAASGTVKFMKFNANAQGVQTLGEDTWTTQWMVFSPLLIDSNLTSSPTRPDRAPCKR